MVSSPSIYNIRCVNMAKALPSNITLWLPGMPEPTNLKQPHMVVRVEFPDMAPYHTCLGRFMDEWGKLEIHLHTLFARLLGVAPSKSAALASTLSGKGLIDALTTLSEVTLTTNSHRLFVNLMERMGTLNTNRNYIVHGYWMAEIILYSERNGDVTFKMKVVREYPAPSNTVKQALANPKNQRYRAKYIFQSKRIDEIAMRIAEFRDELANFTQVEDFPQMLPEGSP